MVSVRFYVDKAKVGQTFTRKGAKVLSAARGAAQDAADDIKKQGDQDIQGAGKFGGRWTGAFHVDVSEGGGSIRLEVKMDIFYWRVFEYGATINGKPLLWIPLSFAADAKGVSAKDFGQLFRVDRKGGKAPLLLAPGKPAQPKYFGKASVTIPQKFHLRDISRSVAKTMRELYLERYNNNG